MLIHLLVYWRNTHVNTNKQKKHPNQNDTCLVCAKCFNHPIIRCHAMPARPSQYVRAELCRWHSLLLLQHSGKRHRGSRGPLHEAEGCYRNQPSPPGSWDKQRYQRQWGDVTRRTHTKKRYRCVCVCVCVCGSRYSHKGRPCITNTCPPPTHTQQRYNRSIRDPVDVAMLPIRKPEWGSLITDVRCGFQSLMRNLWSDDLLWYGVPLLLSFILFLSQTHINHRFNSPTHDLPRLS